MGMTTFACRNRGSVEESAAIIAFAAAWAVRPLAVRTASELVVTFDAAADTANAE